MEHTEFIAVIDLGTINIVGMIGVKKPDGTFQVIAHDVENASSCIRRGTIYKISDTADKIRRLIRKMENILLSKLPEKVQSIKVSKVYVGVGGQSLRSIKHSESAVLGADGLVSEEILDSLNKKSKAYKPDMLDVLDIVSPVYYLDNKPEVHPVGMQCYRIDASYQMIVGRPYLQKNIMTAVEQQARINVAGIFVSPLALANIVLSEEEKKDGCALIDFGGGVTTLTVYKEGNLLNLSVIPFGSSLITKDLTDILTEADAENAKRNHGSARREKDLTALVQIGTNEMKAYEINDIIESRIREILANIYARIEETNVQGGLKTVVITGGGSSLKQLDEVIREKLHAEVRHASVRKGLVHAENIDLGDPIYTVAMSLLANGTENCVTVVQEQKVTTEAPTPTPAASTPPPKVEPEPIKRPVITKNEGDNLFGKLWKKAETFFDEDEVGNSDNRRTK
jgi:cell division protein FtsA